MIWAELVGAVLGQALEVGQELGAALHLGTTQQLANLREKKEILTEYVR